MVENLHNSVSKAVAADPLLVDVCICTYRRASLEATLRSLATQITGPNLTFRVIVADNDETPSARELAEAVAADCGLSLAYIHAPKQNISVARNACLDAASAPWIAFIDDDEEASPHWLTQLMDCVARGGVDVAFGPVDAIYPEGAPDWARRANLHSTRPAFKSEGRIETGYTCNVIMSRDRIGDLRFDPILGRSGGEDTWYFHQLYEDGARLVYCREALVTEHVPPARIKLTWLFRRSFRAGQTRARIFKSRFRAMWLVALISMAKAMYCFAIALFMIPFSANCNRAIVRGALHVGVAANVIGKADLQIY